MQAHVLCLSGLWQKSSFSRWKKWEGKSKRAYYFHKSYVSSVQKTKGSEYSLRCKRVSDPSLSTWLTQSRLPHPFSSAYAYSEVLHRKLPLIGMGLFKKHLGIDCRLARILDSEPPPNASHTYHFRMLELRRESVCICIARQYIDRAVSGFRYALNSQHSE